jgi:tetratricopeptide (TPR) repeat protein
MKLKMVLSIVLLLSISIVSGILLLNISDNPIVTIESIEQSAIVDDIQSDPIHLPEVDDQQLIENGISEYENGNYDGAVAFFLEGLNRNITGVNLFNTYFYLADSYYYMEMYDDAIINFHKALEEKYDYLTTVYLAQTYFLVDDNESASKYFDEAFKIDDERAEAYVFYAEFLYYSGDLNGAEENALVAMDKNPGDLYPVELLVYISFDNEQKQQMTSYYDVLSEADYPYIDRVTEYINQIE